MKRTRLLLFCMLGIFRLALSQTPTDTERQYSNFYDLRKDFYNRPKIKEKQEKLLLDRINGDSRESEEELGELLHFKRWEYFIEPRVYPSGNFFRPSVAWDNYNGYKNSYNKKGSNTFNGAWTSLNPATVNGDEGVGSGRVNIIRFHPNNINTMFVGTAGGGLWKSEDGANTWKACTDNIGALGISDLAIAPSDPNIMYLATGDGEAEFVTSQSLNYSVGVLKSIDGGDSWTSTGLQWDLTKANTTMRILMDPTDPNVLLVATNNGIWKSIDAGATWNASTGVTGGVVRDMEYKPNDPSVVYASSYKKFYKSTDGGSSFSEITSGLPSSSLVLGTDIAVTPDNPEYVYIIYGSASDVGYYGLYRSTNSGDSFSTRSTSPNILGFSTNGAGSGGQSFFTTTLAVSPVNKDVVIAGGVNMWRSLNGGQSWSLVSDWSEFQDPTASSRPYVHADIHEIMYAPDNSGKIYAATDGGVFVTESLGLTWNDKSNGLHIGQIYRIGQSTSDKNKLIMGLQDNNTILNIPQSSYYDVLFGDGMDCFIDWADDSYMYGSQNNGKLNRSSNGGQSFTTISNNISEYQSGLGAWVTPWMMDPLTPQTIYAGYANIWRSTNRGSSWSKLGNISSSSESVKAFQVAPSDPSIIYVIKQSNIYKTTNSGSTWSSISTGLPLSIVIPTAISVHNTDPNKLWVTFSGYNEAEKIYRSTDGGSTWTNISTGLPNLPINTVVYQVGTNDVVYVGADIGIYYSDADNSWTLFSEGLPNCIVSELEIHYASKKIRAATFGRGIWESDLYDVPQPEPTESGDLNVFPNPGDSYFTLEFTVAVADDYTVELRNALGQLVYNEQLTGFSGLYSKKIDLPYSGKGVYLFSVRGSSKPLVKRVVLY